MKDILDKEDVKLLVDEFYNKVRTDSLLAPIFTSRIKEGQWHVHLDKMYKFWSTLLLFERSYKANPFEKHRELAISKAHFDQWIHLFTETVVQNFEGAKAEEIQKKAKSIAQVFNYKMDYLKKIG